MSKLLQTLLAVLVIIAIAIWMFTLLQTCNKENPIDAVGDKIEDVGQDIKETAGDAKDNLADLFEDEELNDNAEGDENVSTNRSGGGADVNDENVKNINSTVAKTDNEPTSTATPSTTNTKPSTSSSRSNRISDNDDSWRYLVVTGNYTHEEWAQEEVRRLKRKGFNDAEVVTFDLSQYYTTIAGRFSGLTAARRVKNQVGGDAYVHRKRSKYIN